MKIAIIEVPKKDLWGFLNEALKTEPDFTEMTIAEFQESMKK